MLVPPHMHRSDKSLPASTTTKDRLRKVGLRPTRQREDLCNLLFRHGDRHVTAEMLYIEAKENGSLLSLATVYNTLAQFCEVGLIRRLPINHSSAVYDTDPSSHQHFVLGANGPVIDMPLDSATVDNLPQPPAGYRIAGVDVVIRLEQDGTPQPACAEIEP